VFARVLVYTWKKGSQMSNELDNGGCISEDDNGGTYVFGCMNIYIYMYLYLYIYIYMIFHE